MKLRIKGAFTGCVTGGAQCHEVIKLIRLLMIAVKRPSRNDVMNVQQGASLGESAILAGVTVAITRSAGLIAPSGTVVPFSATAIDVQRLRMSALISPSTIPTAELAFTEAIRHPTANGKVISALQALKYRRRFATCWVRTASHESRVCCAPLCRDDSTLDGGSALEGAVQAFTVRHSESGRCDVKGAAACQAIARLTDALAEAGVVRTALPFRLPCAPARFRTEAALPWLRLTGASLNVSVALGALDDDTVAGGHTSFYHETGVNDPFIW